MRPRAEDAGQFNCGTRQALTAAKARGVSLGNPKLSVARKSAVEAVTAEADRVRGQRAPDHPRGPEGWRNVTQGDGGRPERPRCRNGQRRPMARQVRQQHP